MKVMSTVTLTSNQKRVLAKIIASPTPKVAGEEISGDQNLIAARDQLGQLGAIEFVAGEATITDKGTQLAQEENIADESGQLTPDGQALAYTSSSGREDKDKEQQTPTTTPPGTLPQTAEPPPPAAPQGGGFDLAMSYTPEYEPLKLLCELLIENESARITRGKAHDSEYAPIVYRFRHVPFEFRDVFNRITQRYKTARDWKKRFHWNKDYKFWYTENRESMEEARKQLERVGVKFD